MGVLSHRLNHAQARNANYEAILRILNDCLQGNVSGIGFLFGGDQLGEAVAVRPRCSSHLISFPILRRPETIARGSDDSTCHVSIVIFS